MRKCVLVLLTGCMLAVTGCTGPFKLTRKLHAWQTSFDEKWIDEVAFLACVFLPVYSFATLGDAIIFNSIEFWTGDNPVASIDLQGENGDTATVALQEDATIKVTDGVSAMTLERRVDGVVARDAAGNLLYRAEKGPDGVVRIYDASGREVKRSKS